ncbi:hypothetical protein GCK32_018496, partial [Trichostrongylus colubriformis]
IEFNVPAAIRHNQFVVKCHRNSTPERVAYNKAFVNVPIATGPASEPKFVKSDPEQPSMALLIFDSVSLNHFKRSMPRTTKFLVDNDFFTFDMYNEVILPRHPFNVNMLSCVCSQWSRHNYAEEGVREQHGKMMIN